MKEYAKIVWNIEDIAEYHPEWTREECCKWWEENEKWFSEVLIEYGNEILSNT